MDPIEVIELCRDAANDSATAPEGIFIPHPFNTGDYQQLWLREPKRVRRLLDELLCGKNVGEGLELLLRFDVLPALFPEVSAMKDLGDAEGLHKDVWSHTKSVVSGVPAEVDMRWGALLHDIGKVKTRRFSNGRVTFHNHDAVGARLVDSLHDRTNLFQDDVALLRTVRYLVLEHLRPASYNNKWSDSAVRRLITECGDVRFFEKLMALSRADLTTKNDRKRKSAGARANELEARVGLAIQAANAPKLPKGTMGVIMSKVDAKPGAWLNELRLLMETMMLEGNLAAGQPVDYYVEAGLGLVNTGVITTF